MAADFLSFAAADLAAALRRGFGKTHRHHIGGGRRDLRQLDWRGDMLELRLGGGDLFRLLGDDSICGGTSSGDLMLAGASAGRRAPLSSFSALSIPFAPSVVPVLCGVSFRLPMTISRMVCSPIGNHVCLPNSYFGRPLVGTAMNSLASVTEPDHRTAWIMTTIPGQVSRGVLRAPPPLVPSAN